MDGFKRRESAFETKFAKDNELEFKLRSKAFSLLATLIARDKLSLNDRAVKRYADRVLNSALRHCNLDATFDYIQKRLSRHGITMSDRELHNLYNLALTEAQQELC